MKLIAAVAAVLLSAVNAIAEPALDFDSLIHAGYSAVSAAARENAASPRLVNISAPVPAPGGVFLFNAREGRIYYCSSGGCRLGLKGGASNVVSTGRGGLYFSGVSGTGFCDESGCRALMAPPRVVFPLQAGPRGDIWGANRYGLWHCAPRGCDSAFTGDLADVSVYLDGVYKSDGDFVVSDRFGTFWCSAAACRRVSPAQVQFIEGRCVGTPPVSVAFGFWAHRVFACDARRCAVVDNDDAQVDDYSDCEFDAYGRLHLPLRGPDGARAGGTLACSAGGCAPDSLAPRDLSSVPFGPSNESETVTVGADGALYRLGRDPNQPGAVFRGDGVAKSLAFDAPDSCWTWREADPNDDEEDSGWERDCRLIK